MAAFADGRRGDGVDPLLDVQRRKLVEPQVTEVRDDVFLDVATVGFDRSRRAAFGDQVCDEVLLQELGKRQL